MLQNLASRSRRSSHLSGRGWGWELCDVQAFVNTKMQAGARGDAQTHNAHASPVFICIGTDIMLVLQSHVHNKTIITDTFKHPSPIQYSNIAPTRFSISPFFSRIYKLHLLHLYISSSAWHIHNLHQVTFQWAYFYALLSLPYFTHSHHHSLSFQMHFIDFRFRFDPWRCRVKLCFCFVDVMTIAFTILMMWWDWPNAKQRSGTDEKTWLADFHFSASSASVCVRARVPSCRVLYHYWQSWNT